MPVTETKLRTLAGRARPKLLKLHDANGLYAAVSPVGGISWRYDFVAPSGRRRTLTIGRWPAITIARARKKREEAEAMLADQLDPCEAKRERKRAAMAPAKPTFEQKAREWHQAQERRWTDDYGCQVLARLEADIFPQLGAKQFADIKRSDILETLRLVEARGVGETVRRLRQYVGAIYRFAGAEDDSIIDPSPMLRSGLKAVPKPVHQPKMKQNELGEFLLRVEEYDGEAETRLALKLTLYTVARTSEILEAEWSEFDALARPRDALWRIAGQRMKAGDPHMIPLSKQAIAVLDELRECKGDKRFLFPIARTTPGRRVVMSNNSMLFAMYRMGYRGRATTHGLRGNFSTWANESGWPSDDVELCLAHDERDRVRGAYNAAVRLEPRRALLQAWADWLDGEKRAARKSRLLS